MGEPFETLWKLMLTGGGIVLTWLHMAGRREIDEMKTATKAAQAEADAAARDLAKHQLFAAENYARRPDVDRGFEKLEQRLGERLDEIKNEIRELKSTPSKH